MTADNHAEFKAADKIVLIAYLDAADEASKTAFSDFADLHRDDYLFGISTDSAATAGVTPPTVVLYKTFDEGRNDLAGSVSAAALADFAREYSVPLLDEISPENFALYAEAGIPLAYIFVEATNPKRDEITKAIEPVAREHKGKINFVWIDATKVRCTCDLSSPGRIGALTCFAYSSPTTPSPSTSPSRPGPRSRSKMSRP